MIGVVARNNLHLTKACVKSALAQDYTQDIIVINNASSDGTHAWLWSQSNIFSVHHVGQKSLSYCWNQILRTAWIRGEKKVLLLNNDTEIRPDTYKYLTWNNIPLVSCVSVRTTEELRFPDPPKTVSPHPDFSCFMIDKSVTDRIGFFDEDFYPAFCEDCDFHVRMHRAGMEAVSIDLPFLHHGSQTIKTADPTDRRAIERGADRCRSRFKSLYGCLPGTEEYSALFT